MNKLNLKLTILTTILLGFVLILLLTFSVNAQTGGGSGVAQGPNGIGSGPNLIDGEACVPNFSNCGPGEINLREAIDNGDIEVAGNTSSNEVIDTFANVFGESTLNQMCVSNTLEEVAEIFVPFVRNPFIIDDDAYSGSTSVIRGCSAGYSLSEAPVSGTGPLGIGSWDVVGCCPDFGTGPGGQRFDYQFVTPAEALSLGGTEYQQNGVCCPLVGGAQPNREGNRGECQDSDGNRIQYPAGVSGIRVADDPNISGDSQRLGTGSGTVRIEAGLGSNTNCLSNNSCAIVDTSISGAVGTPLPNSNLAVVDPNELNSNSQLNCNRCLRDNEAIAVDGGDLLVCDSGSAGLVASEPLVANSVQQTLAARRTDATNRPLLEACAEQGGIYIAIGCVDPTPIGLITGLIRIGFGIMGGVALFQLILAGIAYQQGEEEKITEARDRVLSTLAGIAVLVFSVLIIQIIGVNIFDVIPLGLV